ncbi:hypothetical protein HII36_02020 [Nonomuraea sp. NN258]|uniref:multiubiquitin domain-containing protein n=1 Tax=Nonomuraea antri TaxID=2730852 RepID=UPI0015688C91|nr:multiubiquitin domain-containing protein [Nonomuraea antri]NRQ30619.1 hypothetical protein [Nonomuraea antri]
MTAMPEAEQTGHRVVVIIVNERSVNIEGPRVTGLQIKQAAIEQGVPIELSFLLSEELSNHHTRSVGDSDVVTVNKNSKFTAVADDDNS